MARVIIGLVGTCDFVRGYALGPELSARMGALSWPGHDLTIEEMSWGAIAVVQSLQARVEAPERVVLVGPTDRGLPPGTVSCRRWTGGDLDAAAVQDRVFEAVTGVISLDNLLVIGEHFGIWPDELITVELQLGEGALGELILAEMRGDGAIIGDAPPDADTQNIVAAVIDATQRAAAGGSAAVPDLVPLAASDLTDRAPLCHNRFGDERREVADDG